MADQFGVRLDGIGDVGREQRVAVPGGQVDRLPAGGAAVPDPDGPLVRAGPHLRVAAAGGGSAVAAVTLSSRQMPAEQLVALGVAVPLVLGGDVEQLALGGAVALADDQVQAAAGEVVEGGVVLEGAHRVEQAERGDGGEQPDASGQRGDVAEHDGRRGGDERAARAAPPRRSRRSPAPRRAARCRSPRGSARGWASARR